MQEQAKKPLSAVGKRRLYLSVLFGVTAVCVCWFTRHPLKNGNTGKTGGLPDAGGDDTVHAAFHSLNLTETARGNLAREFAAYNVTYAPQTYYAQLGSIYDAAGDCIYGQQILPLSADEKTYEYQRNRLCMYLYGDTESPAESIMGPEALMRTAEVTSEDFITGADLCLSLRSNTERNIYRLLLDNGISGGCIVQDTASGRIEVMTATSVAGDLTGSSELEALHAEKSGLTQLESCIGAEAVTGFGLTEEELARWFDYHALRSVRTAPDENGADVTVQRYHFLTDFDMLDEADDGSLSPLHVCSITQRIFSGHTATPTLIAALPRTAEDSTRIGGEQPAKCGADLPEELRSQCMARFARTLHTDTADIAYYESSSGGFLYVTGCIRAKDGSADKCFILYARNAPDGFYTRNRCILRLPRCIAYFITHEEV
ncbi:MAG TPA: hypothetical protein DDX71_06640 [Ruminococcus sp.]|nr:hypothetical protein [Ruminococcus sp.]